MKIACLQLNPQIGHFSHNLKRATSILEKSCQSPDIVILPELAFTGYNFSSKNAIEPYLETPSGASTTWAKEISKKYNCYTVIGFPEKYIEPLTNQQKIYNAATVTSPSGELVFHYRKTFLYETDETWGCSESPAGFQTFDLNFKGRNIKTSIGICMDLNPYKFEAPFNKLEFANHCLETGAQLILCPMAWLSPESPCIDHSLSLEEKAEKAASFKFDVNDAPNIDAENISLQETKEFLNPDSLEESVDFIRSPDRCNINYWIIRFFPFLSHLFKRDRGEAVVAFCNRSGKEDTIVYGGTSTILKFTGQEPSDGEFQEVDSRNDSVQVYGYLGRGEEGLLVREVDI